MAAAALCLSALLWSGNFVVGRAFAGQIDPYTLNALRWSLALGALLPFVAGRLWSARRELMRQRGRLVILGATGIAGFNVCVYSALIRIPVVNAILVLSVVPFVILMGAALSGRARLRGLDGLAVLLSLSGVAILMSQGDFGKLTALHFGAGDLWMIGAVLVWAIYTLVLRTMPKDLGSEIVLASAMIVGVCLLVPLALVAGHTDLATLPAGVWAGVAYVGLGASLVAYFCWSFGVRHLGPGIAGYFVNLMPVFGAVLAWIFLGETLGPSQIAGMAIILSAIILSSFSQRSA